MFNTRLINKTLTLVLAVSLMASFVTPLLPVGVMTSYAASESADPADPGIDNLEYELKFLLDAEKVLDQDHALADGYQGLFGITDEPHQLDVLYLETVERDFNQEGWINRLRFKSWKKKDFERTYKIRFALPENDIKTACEAAEEVGFMIPDTGADGPFEAQVDWGYEEMKLSFSLTVTSKIPDKTLDDYPTEAAIEFLKEAMPERENNWKDTDWGKMTLDDAWMAGPIRFLRYTGSFSGRDITVEIWPLEEDGEDSYIVELSFKIDNFADALAGKKEITAFLDDKGILLHEDSLKTQKILDAWIPRGPDPAHKHSLELIKAAESTCTKPGNREYYVCSGCGLWFEDATGLVEIKDKHTVLISAHGHKWDKGTVTKEATYKEEGIRTYTCLWDSDHTKTETIPKKSRSASSGKEEKTERVSAGSGSTWSKDASGWHYQENGVPVAGSWRFLHYNGANDWYYFDDNGLMKTGWLDLNGSRYYLYPVSDGRMGRMLTGWQQVEGNWYYFEPAAGKNQGRMYRSEGTPDGYYVGADGIWEGEH